MKIYVVQPEVEYYKQLADTEPEEMSDARLMELQFDGDPKNGNWNPPTLEWISGADIEGPDRKIYDTKYKIPDIAYWVPGCLVLNPRATKVLKPLFSGEAEFLSVSAEGEEWAILNVTNMQDAIDQANCRYRIRSDGKIGRLLKIALDKKKITNSKLFRLVGKSVHLYTSDVPGSLKEIVGKNGLTGLSFDEC